MSELAGWRLSEHGCCAWRSCTVIMLELGGAGFTDGNRISDSNGDPETFTRLGVSGILPGGDRDKQGQTGPKMRPWLT